MPIWNSHLPKSLSSLGIAETQESIFNWADASAGISYNTVTARHFPR